MLAIVASLMHHRCDGVYGEVAPAECPVLHARTPSPCAPPPRPRGGSTPGSTRKYAKSHEGAEGAPKSRNRRYIFRPFLPQYAPSNHAPSCSLLSLRTLRRAPSHAPSCSLACSRALSRPQPRSEREVALSPLSSLILATCERFKLVVLVARRVQGPAQWSAPKGAYRPDGLPVFGPRGGVGCAPRPQAGNKKHPPGGLDLEGERVVVPGVPVVERVGLGWGHPPCVCVRAQWRGCYAAW